MTVVEFVIMSCLAGSEYIYVCAMKFFPPFQPVSVRFKQNPKIPEVASFDLVKHAEHVQFGNHINPPERE